MTLNIDARPDPFPTPQRLEKMLRTPEAAQTLPASTRRRLETELAERRRHLLHVSCSAAWFSDCWGSGEPFPPRADTTPMIPCSCERCRRVGKLWPALYCVKVRSTESTGDTELLVSFECYLESLPTVEAVRFPSSPSGLALRAIREGRIKIRRTRTRCGRARGVRKT